LVIGGGLSAIGAGIFTFGSAGVGSWMTIAAQLIEAAGLLMFAVGFPQSRLRALLGATAALGMVGVLLTAIIVATNTDIGFGLTLTVAIAQTLLLLISSIGLRASREYTGPIAWALLPAAIWGTIDLALVLIGIGGEWQTLVLLGVLYLVAGVAIRVGSGRIDAARELELSGASQIP
jgi:hypothetical protein